MMCPKCGSEDVEEITVKDKSCDKKMICYSCGHRWDMEDWFEGIFVGGREKETEER